MGWWVVAMASWVGGVWMQVVQPQVASPALFGSVGLLCVAAVVGALAARPRWPRASWLLLAWFGLGWACTSWRAWDQSASARPACFEGQAVVAQFQVDSLVQSHQDAVSFEARVLSYDGHAPDVGWPRRLQVRFRGRPDPSIQPGQQWQARLKLSHATGASNPGGFDLALLYWERGVGAVAQVQAQSLRLVQAQPQHVWQGLVDRWRDSIQQRIHTQVTDARWAGILEGLTIGEQGTIDAGDWEIFRKTGVGHLVSISGSHVAMLGYVLAWVILKLWPRLGELAWRIPSPYASQIGGLIGAAGYAVLAGWGVPAQRTVIMMAAITVLRLSGRRWPWPLVWLFAALVVTAWDPWALLQPGFWLSFVAVGILMSIAHPQQVAELSWFKRLWAAGREMSAVQWRVSIGLAPLTLVFFQQMSWISLPANLLAIPVFTFVITPLALLGIVWSPVWNLAVWVLQIVMGVLAWMSQSNLAVMDAPQLPAALAVLAVMAGAAAVVPMRAQWRWAWLPFALPLAYLPHAWQIWPQPAAGQFTVAAADVGQGSAILIRTQTHTLLFDTGPKVGHTDAGQRVVIPLLRALGIHRLDRLMVSHADMDHVGGAASILSALSVDSFWSSLPTEHPLLQQPAANGVIPVHQPCIAGQSWDWDGVRFAVLHPSPEVYQPGSSGSDNARSCVLRIEALNGQGRVALLTGDIESEQEASLADSLGASGLRSDVLLVPHHGSKTSSTDEFLDRVQPKAAVVQVGAHNRYGHPAPGVMARYQALGIPVLTTVECGAYFWRSDDPHPADADHRCWRSAHAHYW